MIGDKIKSTKVLRDRQQNLIDKGTQPATTADFFLLLSACANQQTFPKCGRATDIWGTVDGATAAQTLGQCNHFPKCGRATDKN
jgi:hypothetical protein